MKAIEIRVQLFKIWRGGGLSIVVGLLAGLSAAVFLYALDWVTSFRLSHSSLYFGLPLAGLLIGQVYAKSNSRLSRGTHLILDEIHDPKKVLPLQMVPLILGSTLLTHLVGGSAGREGTAVQMSASLGDQLARVFSLSVKERRTLLVAATGAGFGAAVGAPWAGVFFGMEVLSIGRMKIDLFLQSALASFTAFSVTKFLAVPHFDFLKIESVTLSWKLIFAVLGVGLVCGLMAKGFVHLVHAIEKVCGRLIQSTAWRPFWGGILLVILFSLGENNRYMGLGLEVIKQAIDSPASWQDPVLKAALTGLTLGSGFKGGEFIPLVMIGATTGSFLSLVLPAATATLSAVGFAATFAGAAHAPIACSIMAAELFGWALFPYALMTCLLSFWVSGHKGIYKTRKSIRPSIF